jgi:hypothetical protein
VFDEDPSYLILAKTQTINAAKEQWVKAGRPIEEFAKQTGIFTGQELQSITIHNERKMLKQLQKCCLNALLRYPTTMQEDQ